MVLCCVQVMKTEARSAESKKRTRVRVTMEKLHVADIQQFLRTALAKPPTAPPVVSVETVVWNMAQTFARTFPDSPCSAEDFTRAVLHVHNGNSLVPAIPAGGAGSADAHL